MVTGMSSATHDAESSYTLTLMCKSRHVNEEQNNNMSNVMSNLISRIENKGLLAVLTATIVVKNFGIDPRFQL